MRGEAIGQGRDVPGATAGPAGHRRHRATDGHATAITARLGAAVQGRGKFGNARYPRISTGGGVYRLLAGSGSAWWRASASL